MLTALRARAFKDWTTVRSAAAQLASALAHCHAHGVAHRDVKPENILQCGSVGSPCWKLADFGAASVSKADPSSAFPATVPQRIQSTRAIGSAAYAAPEVVRLMEATHSGSGEIATTHPAYEVYGVDVWSFGVTLFVLAAGRAPFRRASGSDAGFLGFCAATQGGVLSPRAAQVAPSWSWPAQFSAGLIDVLSACLQVDPSHRASMSEVCDMPWLRLGSPRTSTTVHTVEEPTPSQNSNNASQNKQHGSSRECADDEAASAGVSPPGGDPGAEVSTGHQGETHCAGVADAAAMPHSLHPSTAAMRPHEHVGLDTPQQLSDACPAPSLRLPSIASAACRSDHAASAKREMTPSQHLQSSADALESAVGQLGDWVSHHKDSSMHAIRLPQLSARAR